MSQPPRQRTVDDVAAPYANYLVRVPRVAIDVCEVCHSLVDPQYARCYQCSQASRQLPHTADVVSFVSLAPNTGQMATELYTYKRIDIHENLRRARQIGLAAVLWKWLALHEHCMARHVGAERFDLITTVPSTSGRPGTHPLDDLVSKVVVGSGDRYVPLLALGASAAAHRGFAVDRFAVSAAPTGRTVLIIDDTWTTGAHAQSAAAALKAAGARGVGILAIGRWMNIGWKNTSEWLHQHRGAGWDWNRCCLEH